VLEAPALVDSGLQFSHPSLQHPSSASVPCLPFLSVPWLLAAAGPCFVVGADCASYGVAEVTRVISGSLT
jgi:hypothetical protein